MRLLGLICFMFLFWGLNAQDVESPLQFLELVHDFGDVPETGGPLSEEFLFVNRAGKPVTILSVKASCGCTTTGWSKDSTDPGETGYVRAKYDPTGRPGYFNKTLTVTTDYDSQPMILQIKGQVIQKSGTYAGAYRVKRGAWRLHTGIFNMGTVYHSATPSEKEFIFYNESKEKIQISAVDAPAYITVQAPAEVAPGSEGKITLTYFGNQRPVYGLQSDNVTFHTTDPELPLKSFSVYATLEDDFSKLSDDAWESAPNLILGGSSFDFGHISQGGSYTHQVAFTNSGRSSLEIRSVQGNCTCILSSANPVSLQPGASGTITITFRPGERLNTQQKTVMIYSNDPKTPVKRIIFNAYVTDN